MAANDNAAAGNRSRRAARAALLKNLGALLKNLGNIVIVLSALGVLIVALWSLRDVWHGRPLAAAFTRVGGATLVETALEASRFWLTPPPCVVMTDASPKQSAKQQALQEPLMFAAARYAMSYDAPLLFTTQDPKRNQLVHATITAWQADAIARKQKQPVMVMFQLPDDRIGSCPGKADPAGVDGLSTLAVPNQPLQLPPVFAPRDTLAPVVVFAAAIEPADPPDVAVGMALAAHMARANREKVSLVIVPHYLESDPKLENKLEKQHEPVTGGVVLGQTPTVPEDTRVLLRQLLTSRDQLGVLAQVQASLASLGSLVTVLLTAFGAGVGLRVAPEIGHQAVELGHHTVELGHQLAGPTQRVAEFTRQVAKRAREQLARGWARAREQLARGWARAREQLARGWARARKQLARGWGFVMARFRGRDDPGPFNWPLGDVQESTVTVWLRSGWTLTGTMKSQDGSDAGQSQDRGDVSTRTVLRLNGATLVRAEDHTELTQDFVLVPVADIELIGVKAKNPETPEVKPT